MIKLLTKISLSAFALVVSIPFIGPLAAKAATDPGVTELASQTNAFYADNRMILIGFFVTVLLATFSFKFILRGLGWVLGKILSVLPGGRRGGRRR